MPGWRAVSAPPERSPSKTSPPDVIGMSSSSALSPSSSVGGARWGRREWSTTSWISDFDHSVNTVNRAPLRPVIS